MGMAASQARFLGLTARKTNTEYEGQQVNQQRTALANQSSGLYNKMLTLKVPTPPDSTDYYNLRYTYSYGAEGYEITSYSTSSSDEGVYDVTVKHSYTATKAFKQTTNNVNLQTDGSGGYTINIGSSNKPITLEQVPNLATELNLTNNNFYTYTVGDKKYYMTQDDFNTYTQNQTQDYTGSTTNYYYANTTQTDYEDVQGVTFVVDSAGNFTKIIVPNQGEMSLTTESVKDDEGYEKAMNEYTLQKDLYDRVIANINAQTEIIQQQDRTLELRLKQLDTEQSALQTELDAVTKVIEKNVESTFKTFA